MHFPTSEEHQKMWDDIFFLWSECMKLCLNHRSTNTQRFFQITKTNVNSEKKGERKVFLHVFYTHSVRSKPGCSFALPVCIMHIKTTTKLTKTQEQK